jgi:hypothetical protein
MADEAPKLELGDRTRRALARWPNVPHLYGWLRLDHRGRWLIRGEPISRPQIVETINANFGVDPRGCWYFQNGPQRGYVAIDAAPLILHAPESGDALGCQLHRPVGAVRRAALDEGGGLWLDTALGPGWLADRDLGWALQRMATTDGAPLDEALAAALAQASGTATALRLVVDGRAVPVERIDEADIAPEFGFVREPTASTP